MSSEVAGLTPSPVVVPATGAMPPTLMGWRALRLIVSFTSQAVSFLKKNKAKKNKQLCYLLQLREPTAVSDRSDKQGGRCRQAPGVFRHQLLPARSWGSRMLRASPARASVIRPSVLAAARFKPVYCE